MKAKQFFNIIIGALAVLLLGGGAGYYMASRLIQAQTATLKQRLATDTAAADEISTLHDVKLSYLKLEPIIPKIEEALPRSKQQSEIALQIESLARTAGMQPLPGITFTSDESLPAPTSQTVKSIGGASALPITFSLSGTYPQLQTFLQSIEALNRYTNVSSLSIAHDGDEKNPILKFGLTINVYIKP